ncbi:MAG: aldehyde dehydrogenase family protein [Lawsonibacter sp.]
MRCAGQTCVAPQRVFVHASVLEEFSALCVEMGNTAKCGMADEDANVGALISQSAVRRMEEIVADAVAKGAKILCGGKRPEGKKGCYFLPTILANVTSDMKAINEEIFGPIMSIIPYETEEQVIAMANNTQYGLSSYVWSTNYYEVSRIVKGLQFGVVNVNGPGTGPNYPHGGWKDSGIGADGSCYSLDEYYCKKSIRVALA